MHISIVQSENNKLTKVYVGPITLWFSYNTCVAFRTDRRGGVVRKNDWSATTGKHLNIIDGGSKDAKDKRVDGEAFEQALSEVMTSFNIDDVERV